MEAVTIFVVSQAILDLVHPAFGRIQISDGVRVCGPCATESAFPVMYGRAGTTRTHERASELDAQLVS